MNNNIKKRITAAAMAGIMAASGASLVDNNNEDEYLQSHFEHDRKKIEYINYINNADLSEFDEVFVNFYRDGSLNINGIEYKIKDLYLECGTINGEEKVFLVYYRFPNKDILTNEDKIMLKRSSVMLLGNSYCFYQIYQIFFENIVDNSLIINESNMNEISSLIKSFDGTIHNQTPENLYSIVDTSLRNRTK